MSLTVVPDFQWAIVTLADGSKVAGYVHREHDDLNHTEVEIDIPAASGWPASIAVIDPAHVAQVKCCGRAEVVEFITTHGWPSHARKTPAYRGGAEADLDPQGAD